MNDLQKLNAQAECYRAALEKIAAVCKPRTFNIEGVDIGEVAATALGTSPKPKPRWLG